METIAILGPMLASAATTSGSFLAANAPLIGAGIGAAGTIFQGVRANESAQMEAKQLKRQGEEELAVAQREANVKRREARIANSRNLAVAASSGAGASDPTVTQIMADTDAQGVYNALTEMYKGFQGRNEARMQAGVRKQEGRSALSGSLIDAAGTIFSGFGENRRLKKAYSEP